MWSVQIYLRVIELKVKNEWRVEAVVVVIVMVVGFLEFIRLMQFSSNTNKWCDGIIRLDSYSFSCCIWLADNFVAIVLRFCGSLFVHSTFFSLSLSSHLILWLFFLFCFFTYYNPNTHSFVHKHRMSNGIVHFQRVMGLFWWEYVCVCLFFLYSMLFMQPVRSAPMDCDNVETNREWEKEKMKMIGAFVLSSMLSMYVAYCPNLQRNCLIINDSLGYIFHILDDDFTNILWQCCWSWHLRVWMPVFIWQMSLLLLLLVFFFLSRFVHSFVCLFYVVHCYFIFAFLLWLSWNTRRYSYIAFADDCVYEFWRIVSASALNKRKKKRQMIPWFGFYHVSC